MESGEISKQKIQADKSQTKEQSQQPSFKNIQSPFKLPGDEEVFLTREIERQKRMQEKVNQQSKNIWQKPTASTLSALKRPKWEALPEIKDIAASFPQNQRGIVAQALNIVNDPENKSRVENPSIEDYINQKREMFLVQMQHDTLRQEIEKLQQRRENKFEALTRSEKMLQEDQAQIERYKHISQNAMDTAQSNANYEQGLKKDADADLKKLEGQKATTKAESQRNEEQKENLQKFKDFLKSIRPEDDPETIQRLEKEYNNEKMLWVAAELEKEEEQDNSSRKKSGRKEETNRKKELETQYDEFHKELWECEKNILGYFKTHEQLLDMFRDKQDQNLFLIQQAQDYEKEYEELKTDYQRLQYKKNAEVQLKRKQKEDLINKIKQAESKLNMLDLNKATNTENQEQTAKSLGHQIGQIFSEISGGDAESQNSIDMLREIEYVIIYSINQMDKFREDESMPKKAQEKLDEVIQKAENQRKFRKTQKNKQIAIQATKERQERTYERLYKQVPKKTGKPVMAKSFLAPKEKRVIVKKEENTEDREIREFLNSDEIDN